MALFTVENAAEMGRRSAELRKQREAAAAIEPEQPAILPLPTVQPTDEIKSRAIARTLEQIDRIDNSLEDCVDAKDWDALTRAKERLFKAWVHLAGIPGPGQLKPTSTQPKRELPRVMPQSE